MSGMWLNKYDVKRGDYIEVPNLLDAKVLQARGMVDIGKVPLDRLGPAHREDQNLLEVLQHEVNERDRRMAAEAEVRRSEPLPRRDFDAETRRDVKLSQSRKSTYALNGWL
jgi:hypothetical protein